VKCEFSFWELHGAFPLTDVGLSLPVAITYKGSEPVRTKMRDLIRRLLELAIATSALWHVNLQETSKHSPGSPGQDAETPFKASEFFLHCPPTSEL
jgi:hypothetical protein